MPSPLKGLISPPASPTTRVWAPGRAPRPTPIGRRPPVGGPHEVWGESPHDLDAWSTNASIRREVLRPFHRRSVDKRPTPAFTRPSPSGKIQPYPGTMSPLVSRMSEYDSFEPQSLRHLVCRLLL